MRTKKKKNPNLKIDTQAEDDDDSLSEGEARQIRIYDNLADYSEFLSRLTKDDDDLDVIYENLKNSGQLKQISDNKGLQLLKKNNDIARTNITS